MFLWNKQLCLRRSGWRLTFYRPLRIDFSSLWTGKTHPQGHGKREGEGGRCDLGPELLNERSCAVLSRCPWGTCALRSTTQGVKDPHTCLRDSLFLMPSLSVIFVRPRYANAKGQAFLPVNSRGSHILCLVHRWEGHYQDLSLGGNTFAWALRSLNISTQTKHFGAWKLSSPFNWSPCQSSSFAIWVQVSSLLYHWMQFPQSFVKPSY